MAIVHLSGELVQYADGLAEVEAEGARVIDIVHALSRRFPALAGRFEHMAVAIDGEIYQDADYRPVRPTSEIHFMPPVQGG